MFGKIRKAIEDYEMICEGDKIAVGVSGGKDSLTLLNALVSLQRYYPERFALAAVTVDIGIGNFDVDTIRRYCDSLGVPCMVEKTYIGKLVFEERKEKNPCSLCANMKKGTIHNMTTAMGCNKLAFAHNYDDTIETFLMSLFYEGRAHVYSPVTYLSRRDITLIRPLIYVREGDIQDFVRENRIPVVKNHCPANGNTVRQYIKEEVARLEKDNKYIKSNIFHAIKSGGFDGW